jgi:hypothetical protein
MSELSRRPSEHQPEQQPPAASPQEAPIQGESGYTIPVHEIRPHRHEYPKGESPFSHGVRSIAAAAAASVLGAGLSYGVEGTKVYQDFNEQYTQQGQCLDEVSPEAVDVTLPVIISRPLMPGVTTVRIADAESGNTAEWVAEPSSDLEGGHTFTPADTAATKEFLSDKDCAIPPALQDEPPR